MKYIQSLTFIVLSVVIISSCGKPEGDASLANKKEKLASLKQDRKKLNEKIAKLEAEIAKLDSNMLKNTKAKLVAVKDLQLGTFTNYIDLMGKVDADQNTNVSVEMPGTLQKINVTIGQTVSIGQTLGEIDNSVSSVAVNELKQQLEFAKTMYEKQKSLWDQKIGSEVQYLTAKNNYESLQKRMATTNQQLGLARIKAPISGVIDEIYVKAGQMVSPGIPCFRIVNTSKLKIKADIAESYADKVKQGNQVVLYFADLNREVAGTVSYCSRVIDPLTRSFRIEIPLSGNGEFKPNMMATIRVVNYTNPKAIVVPVNTVRTIGDDSYVMVAENRDGKLKAIRRKVTVSMTYNGWTEVTSGLNPGDKLITTGYQELEDGDEIRF